MRDIKIASRYAKALLKIAVDEKVLEEVYNDMQLVNDVCSENHDLTLLLKSPIVKRDKKSAILSEIFGEKISKISNTFISIILTKKREGLLADITNAFIDSYKIYKNITTVSVTTAMPLTENHKSKITVLLKSQGHENIDLKEIVNADIIGGLILRIGDKQIDESIKRKLKNLEMEFDNNLYIKEY
ncbi:MAG: ATP synthase F1 subunit delta [Flavobacteriales bacterium]|nr:MAG: ATP synthase F1 subunit delta [Flavobacteriales bacterium]